MRKLVSLFVLSAFLPSVALAQSPPPVGPPPNPAAFKQLHEKMEQIHRNLRSQVLGALTPAHRALLAHTVGDLAVAANPDPKAAAAKFDAALSASEKSAIQNAHKTAMTAMRQQMLAMRSQLHPQGPQPQHSTSMRKHHERHEPSAGEIVLMVATMGEHPRGMPPFMGRPDGMRTYQRGGAPGGAPPPPAPNPANT
jgi:hypothetical protein